MTTLANHAPVNESAPLVEPPTFGSGKSDHLVRLRRTEGQVRGLQRMLADDRSCPEIVPQIAAAIRGLQEVALGLVNDDLRRRVLAPDVDLPERQARLDETTSAIRQVVRL